MILLINDLSTIFTSNILLFDDDLIFFNNNSCNNDYLIHQNDFNILSDLCQNNKFFLNINKCEFLTFTRKKYFLRHVYIIENEILKSL